MSYNVKHQVFVSSTFTDLKDERAEVIQALWELDCIPTGMEAFVATNESQWEVIKRVIDECDYYVLILGGRYGSTTNDGISYTEKEYRYAQKIGIPVLAFVHADPEKIESGKSEKDEDRRNKLTAFRKDVMDRYPIKSWKTASELGAVVSRSVVREIKIHPRPGWIRNDGSSPVALLQQISLLTEENLELKSKVAISDGYIDRINLSEGSDDYEIAGDCTYRPKDGGASKIGRWKAIASWDDLFKDIGPLLINEASEDEISSIIARFHGWSDPPAGMNGSNHEIDPEVLSEVLIQFRALGFIEKGRKKRPVSDKSRYWLITSEGESHLINLLAIRREAD